MQSVRQKRIGRRHGKTKDELALWKSFAAGLCREYDTDRIESHDGMLFYDDCGLPEVKGLRFLRKGVFLGECRKNRFEPSQALAMTLKKEDYENTWEPSAEDDRVVRYLKGETLSASDAENLHDGGVLICVDGFPLGWGKKTGSTVKNKYHSSWRLM